MAQTELRSRSLAVRSNTARAGNTSYSGSAEDGEKLVR